MCPCEQEPHSRALLLEHPGSWAPRVLRRVLLFLKLGQDTLGEVCVHRQQLITGRSVDTSGQM